MSMMKRKTVYLADDRDVSKFYNALSESGQLETAIKLTERKAMINAILAVVTLFLGGIGFILPFGLTAYKLWQGSDCMLTVKTNHLLKILCKIAFLLGFGYTICIGYLLGALGLFKKKSYPRLVVPRG